MDRSAARHETAVVAVLCPEPQLDRLLRTALEADGFYVDARQEGIGGRPSPSVTAVVADLDSLGWRPETADAELAAIGFDDTIARVLISARPPEPNADFVSKMIYLQASLLAARVREAAEKPPRPVTVLESWEAAVSEPTSLQPSDSQLQR